MSVLARINAAIARGEALPEAAKIIQRIGRPLNLSLPNSIRWIAAVFFLALGVMRGFLQWNYNGSWFASDTIALLIIGGALLLGHRLLRPGATPAVERSEASENDVSIRLLGYDVNLALLQTLAFGALLVFVLWYDIESAQNSAIVACLMVPLLWQSKLQKFSIALGLISFCYIVHIWISYDYRDLHLISIESRLMPYVSKDILAFIWVLLAISVLPQLQIPQIDKVGIGRFKGDFYVHIFGSHVPVAITSSLILIHAVSVPMSIWYAPGTILAVHNELF